MQPERAKSDAPLSLEQAQHLLHELRVHQAELEAQNEQLRSTQLELQEAQARYFDLYELAPVGYFSVNEEGLIQQLNLTAATLLEVPRSLLLGCPLARFVLAADQDVFYRYRRRLLRSGTPQKCELRMVRPDGTTFWAQLDASVAHTADQALVLRLAVGDIDQRKAAEQAQRASEAHFRALFESSRDALMTFAPPNWHIISANRAAIAILGARDEAELNSRTPWHASPSSQPDGRASDEKALEMVQKAMREGSHIYEWTYLKKNGKPMIASVLLTRVELEGRPMLQATLRDETESRALQARMAQSDRLSTMGMLAAGVAHEINNPLTYVVLNLERLTQQLPKFANHAQSGEAPLLHDAESSARAALEGAYRIKALARGLGTFSRIDDVELTRIDLNAAIEQAATLAQNEIKFRARLEKQLRMLPPILGSQGKLSQVFLNLLVNASHAIDEGNVAGNRILVRTWAEAGRVFAEISDTGKGIPPENYERIFEPFFTTKGVGSGSGLGLSICKTILGNLGGTISVQSVVGQGSRFTLSLPAVTSAPKVGLAAPPDPPSPRLEAPSLPPEPLEPVGAAPETPSPARETPTPTAERERGRILLVDDEAPIRRALQTFLELEHDVVSLGSGEEARALLERDRAFDLVLCDVMMPNVSGMELHAWMVSADPELAKRVVFMSGGAFTPKAVHYLASVENPRLEKPFDVNALSTLLAQRVRANPRAASPAR